MPLPTGGAATKPAPDNPATSGDEPRYRRQAVTPGKWFRQAHHTIVLDHVAEHGMSVVAAFGVHQYRLGQPPTNGGKELAEQVKSVLPLQFPQVDIEVDRVG